MSWVFTILTLVSATLATLAHDLKYSILCLWIAGLSTGAIFLTVDAEFLGIIQWIISTLVAISFVFFAVMFGDFGSTEKFRGKTNYLMLVCSVLIGIGFSGLVWVATEDNLRFDYGPEKASFEINSIGNALVSTHFPSLEILTITLFIVLVGCGAITRIDKGDSK